MSNRRSFLQHALGLSAALFTTSRLQAEALPAPLAKPARKQTGSSAPSGVPAVTTDVGDLPYTMDGDVKVFRLTAQVLKREIAPGKTIDVWGYNGSAPGPTIQVREGDRVRVIFRNELPEPSSMHWHGFEDAIAYDGMPVISQPPVLPGEEFTYEFNIHQQGTYFYHSHLAMQEMAGMLGAFLMHPREPEEPHCDKDFVLLFQEYAVMANSSIPNTMEMEFNWLVINGKSGPAATPLVVRQGDRVRLRMINLGMDHHPIHLHGHTFHVTGTEGGRIQPSAWWPGNTVLVGVAQARDVEFVANNPGDWMLHCHMPHHMMNGMAPQAGPMTRTMTRPMPRTIAGTKQDPMHGSAMAPGQRTAKGASEDPLADADLDASLGSMATDTGGTHGINSMPGMDMGGSSSTNMNMSPGMNMSSSVGDHSGMNMDMGSEAAGKQRQRVSADANSVPNYPQDAFMEGPMMQMDKAVTKPENSGLRTGWSQYMQGMMTFLRVLPPAQYEQVVQGMRQAARAGDPYASLYRETQGETQRGNIKNKEVRS